MAKDAIVSGAHQPDISRGDDPPYPPEEAAAVHVILAIIGIGWIVFWVGWLIAAFTAKSSLSGAWGGMGGGLRVGLVIVIFVLVRVNVGSGHRAIAGPLLGAIGLAVWAAGLALAVWARIYIGRNWGMPMTKRRRPPTWSPPARTG